MHARRLSKAALVRAGFELNSDKVGEIAPGTTVGVLEERENSDGSKRAAIALEHSAGLYGWITSVTSSGAVNLRVGGRPTCEVTAAKPLAVRQQRGQPAAASHHAREIKVGNVVYIRQRPEQAPSASERLGVETTQQSLSGRPLQRGVRRHVGGADTVAEQIARAEQHEATLENSEEQKLSSVASMIVSDPNAGRR